MTAFNFKAEIAWDSGFSTAEGSRTWTDITAYVDAAVGVGITYGRADELSAPDPNTMAMTLKNDDGRFTPDKASSPYYPNVKKGKPVRVSVQYAGVWYVRFTGYVNEWPLVWPTGGQESSSVSITASSRRARMGQTAPLTSAIRAAYLASSPDAYWPMDEDVDTTDLAGRQAFRAVRGGREQVIGSFYSTDALKPVVRDGTQGPTDEASLVKLPAFSDFSLVNNYPHYVGNGAVFSIFTTGALSVEAVARVSADPEDNPLITIVKVMTASQSQRLSIAVNSNGGSAREVAAALGVYDEAGALIEGHITDEVAGYNPAAYDAATDGEVHHYAITLASSGGNVDMKGYFDGVQVGTTLTLSTSMTQRFTQIAMGDNTYQGTLWVGHAAVYDRTLTAAEILDHANAATAASETEAERVTRLAGRVGIPPAEVDTEAGLAMPLGAQAEAGRSAAEVLDEVAVSTGGVLFDKRNNHLTFHPRNHRYNQAVAFTLSASAQEVEGNLTAVHDDRYLTNSVELTRVSADASALPTLVTDDASIDEFGVYSKTIQIVSASDQALGAAGADQILRYAQPGTRVSQISVDVRDLSTSQRALVLAADIGTRFAIAGLPSQAPSDPMNLFLEGYSEDIGLDSHTMTINTTPGDFYSNVLVLNDATRGVLNSSVTLAY